MTKLAIAILTCDRYEYTLQTVKTLFKQNSHQLGQFELYYGDDASKDSRIHILMDNHGFERIASNKERMGCAQTTDMLLNTIASRRLKCDYILYLQNDIISVKPIDIDMITRLFEEHPFIGALRMYGEYKCVTPAKSLKVSDIHLGRHDRKKAEWKDIKGFPDYEMADIHVGLQATIFRSRVIPLIMTGAQRDNDVEKKWAQTGFTVARVKENVFSHIGNKKTPDGKWGRYSWEKKR